jgi:hypothetical protein
MKQKRKDKWLEQECLEFDRLLQLNPLLRPKQRQAMVRAYAEKMGKSYQGQMLELRDALDKLWATIKSPLCRS